MTVKIRLARHGRKHTPLYRVVAIDSREHREGKAVEVLGTYNPHLADNNIQVDIDACRRWIDQGAQYSASVASLLKRQGIEIYSEAKIAALANQQAKTKKARQERAKKAGTKWSAPSRRAVRAHQAKLKAARMAQAAEALAAHKAAQEAAAPAEEASED